MMTFNRNDVSGSSIVLNIESIEWRHFNKTLRVCQSLWWGSYLSTATKYNNDSMKCPTRLTTIIYHVPRNYYKEYRVLIPGINKEKRQGKKEKKKRQGKKEKNKKWKMKQKQTCSLREQAKSGEDEVVVCWWYGQSYDVSKFSSRTTKKAKRTQPRWGQRQPKKTSLKSRPQRGGGFSLNLDLCLVFRSDLVCDIARFIAIYHDIMSRIMRYHKIRYIEISYHIYIPFFLDWYGDIVSRRFISRYRTLFFAS